ncbi:MAG: type II toxin-antitoxin system RelE/ParE family toxin [Verrucomicrobia bacterium]|nr:type II toxin-antitoxin system RelE/ParE family toxin [Verrucomicrobiota bacterium]
MNIVNLPSAREDLADGFVFYEEREEGVGSYFLESLFSDIESLRLCAGMHRKVFGFHRLLSKRFPYAVYYSMEEDTVFIWAVVDCRQDPASIQRKLKFRR